ncbi:putative serine/threonine-protein kinase PRKY isoform X3 [Heptranchias perlo]|uniref:putative serine/threonine-protein kinase PRKY isoform X3 n=1 Tax=Heptranchias perlo TaxID=212740 RepID=UPI00355956D6
MAALKVKVQSCGSAEPRLPVAAAATATATGAGAVVVVGEGEQQQASGDLPPPPPPPPPPSSAAPHQARDYQMEDLETVATVGTGTFGRVLLVKDKKTREYCALKAMSIPDVIRLKQEQHVHNEKSILTEIHHPFLIKLYWTHHDERFLYMLMEYVPGGELFSYLRNLGRFNNSTGLFYSAEIVCAIEYLHAKDIVYRDLKPENILLDREGHIKLTDFGFAKKLVDRTWTLCGTPEYLAPEVIQSKGHGRAVDWWALGVLMFEMLSGWCWKGEETALNPSFSNILYLAGCAVTGSPNTHGLLKTAATHHFLMTTLLVFTKRFLLESWTSQNTSIFM